MSDFLGGLGRTLKSLGGALEAPYGLAYDLASMPFDNKADDFGTMLEAAGTRFHQALDPFSNDNTWTGHVFGRTMHAFDVAYREGVSEPISTADTMIGHVTYDPRNIADLTDPAAWAQAYHVAQHRSIGQSVLLETMNAGRGLFGDQRNANAQRQADNLGLGWAIGGDVDPMDPSAYRQLHNASPYLSTLMSGTSDFVARWYLDPGNVLGRGLGHLHTSVNFRYLGSVDRANALAKMTGQAQDPLFGMAKGLSFVPIFGGKVADKVGLQSRTDRWINYILGANKQGRELNAAEINAVTPELRNSAKGIDIAKAVSNTSEITDPAERRMAIKQVLGVAMGDPYAMDQLRTKIGPAAAIMDALDNAAKGGTLDLKTLANDPIMAQRPEYIADLERQLQNQNDSGQVDQFVKDFLAKQDQATKEGLAIKGTAGTLTQAPGAHARDLPLGMQSGASARALKRETSSRVIDKFHAGEQNAVEWARSLKADPESSVFQKGIHSVPLAVVKVGKFALSPWAEWPTGFADALRQVHYAGIAHLHDWNGATTQLDSMMRLAGVDDATRTSALSDAYGAMSEADKLGHIDKVENIAIQALAAKHSARIGEEVDRAFIDNLMMNGSSLRTRTLASLRGRAYAATTLPDDAMSARMQDLSNETGVTWRVDQVPDENGTPLSVPLFETQLGNAVPLIDVDFANRLLSRDSKIRQLAAHSQAWKDEATYARGLQAKIQARVGKDIGDLSTALNATYKTMDLLTEAAQTAMRWWKFSVLFRLGFPIRVLGDDHMRIAAQMSYLTDFAGPNTGEWLKNAWWNKAPGILSGDGRYSEAARALKTAQEERKRLLVSLYGDERARNLSQPDWDKLQENIKGALDGNPEAQAAVDKLDPDGAVYTYYSRKRDVLSLTRSRNGKANALREWEKALEEADTKRSLGIQVDTGELRQKIHDAKAFIADKQGGIDHLMEQMGDEDPATMRKQIEDLTGTLREGVKGSLAPKRTIGSRPITLGQYEYPGPFGDASGEAYRESSSSEPSFHHLMNGIEDKMTATLGRGSYTTIAPHETGHLDAWADVLNHQVRMSKIAMFFVKDPNATAQDFAEWIMEPEQRILRQRVETYAHDPLGWGKRVEALVRDYIPNEDLRQAVKSGPVSARSLGKMFRDQKSRPTIHGQSVDIATGRNTTTRLMASMTNGMYKYLSDAPTDALTRHPYFNTLYKRALKEQHATFVQAQKAGRMFTEADRQMVVDAARKVALNHIKQTLFDVSAHSHAAHVMRFLSPFFSAHQEAMSRWWNIVRERPDVIRKFQLAFDIPARLSTSSTPLIYDVTTGEPVKPGEEISQNHHILLRVPEVFGGTHNPLDKWLKDLGGGRYWEVSQNGFNIVLQSGIFNPGVGPVVSVPAEALVQKYADKTNFVSAVRAINPYPPNTPLEGALPVPIWAQRTYDAIHHGSDWHYAYAQNLREDFVTYQLDHNGSFPTSNDWDTMMDRAGQEATRDVLLRAVSNIASITPMRPGSKYAVQQDGWTKIRETADAQGHDFQWMLDQFKAKYGEQYLALVYSDSLNPGQLTGTSAEVAAVKRFSPLIKRVDPKLVKAIVGPTAAQAPKDARVYSTDARHWLEGAPSGALNDAPLIDAKTPKQTVLSVMVNSGWEKYTALTDALTLAAQAQGYSSYESSDSLVHVKDIAVQELKKENFAWYEDYMTRSQSPYQTYLDGFQKIVDYKPLWKDPTRVGDVKALQQYLSLRDAVDTALQARGLNGGSKGYNAKDNADLMTMFLAGVSSLREKSPYFDSYYYNGIIEFDPYITTAVTEAQAAKVGAAQ